MATSAAFGRAKTSASRYLNRAARRLSPAVPLLETISCGQIPRSANKDILIKLNLPRFQSIAGGAPWRPAGVRELLFLSCHHRTAGASTSSTIFDNRITAVGHGGAPKAPPRAGQTHSAASHSQPSGSACPGLSGLVRVPLWRRETRNPLQMKGMVRFGMSRIEPGHENCPCPSGLPLTRNGDSPTTHQRQRALPFSIQQRNRPWLPPPPSRLPQQWVNPYPAASRLLIGWLQPSGFVRAVSGFLPRPRQARNQLQIIDIIRSGARRTPNPDTKSAILSGLTLRRGWGGSAPTKAAAATNQSGGGTGRGLIITGLPAAFARFQPVWKHSARPGLRRLRW